MKINTIEKSETCKSHSENSFFFKITVEFEAPAEDPYFGMLGQYFKAIVLLDREKYEQHYSHFDKMICLLKTSQEVNLKH